MSRWFHNEQEEPPLTPHTKATVIALSRERLERTLAMAALLLDDADPDNAHHAQLVADLKSCDAQLVGLAEKLERE